MIQRTVGNVQHSPATPLRAVVINNSSAGITPVASVSSLVPLAQVAQMQKQYFSHVKFKCLSFEELGVSLVNLWVFLWKYFRENISNTVSKKSN